jgi:hypothetical protein
MPFLLEPVHFLMERKMLRTIERRVRRRRQAATRVTMHAHGFVS